MYPSPLTGAPPIVPVTVTSPSQYTFIWVFSRSTSWLCRSGVTVSWPPGTVTIQPEPYVMCVAGLVQEPVAFSPMPAAAVR